MKTPGSMDSHLTPRKHPEKPTAGTTRIDIHSPLLPNASGCLTTHLATASQPVKAGTLQQHSITEWPVQRSGLAWQVHLNTGLEGNLCQESILHFSVFPSSHRLPIGRRLTLRLRNTKFRYSLPSAPRLQILLVPPPSTCLGTSQPPVYHFSVFCSVFTLSPDSFAFRFATRPFRRSTAAVEVDFSRNTVL